MATNSSGHLLTVVLPLVLAYKGLGLPRLLLAYKSLERPD